MTEGIDASPLARFDAVRVISLPTRPDRRQEMGVELARVGAALDGGQIAFHDAARPAEPAGFPSVGAHGCFLSHLQVLEEAEAKGWTNIAILEDDASFSDGQRAQVGRVLAALWKQPWSIFYGGSPQEGVPEAPLKRLAPDDPIGLTHFMAFRGEGITRAIPYLRAMLGRPAGSPDGGPMHVDGAYSWLRRAHPDLAAYAATPPIAYQRASRTDIADTGAIDRVPVVRELVALARRVKQRVQRRE